MHLENTPVRSKVLYNNNITIKYELHPGKPAPVCQSQGNDFICPTHGTSPTNSFCDEARCPLQGPSMSPLLEPQSSGKPFNQYHIISYQNTGSDRFRGWNQRKNIQGKLSSAVWLVTSSHTWSCSPHLPPPPASSRIFPNQDLATASPCSLVGGLLSVVGLALTRASLGLQATTAGLISSR